MPSDRKNIEKETLKIENSEIATGKLKNKKEINLFISLAVLIELFSRTRREAGKKVNLFKLIFECFNDCSQ